MNKIQFADPAVNEKYEPTGDTDLVINMGKHHGKLSGISPATAEALIKVKDPNIKLKTAAPSAPAK